MKNKKIVSLFNKNFKIKKKLENFLEKQFYFKMDLKAVQENLSNYSGVNLVTRCIFLNKKKNEHSLDILKIALKECLRCGYLDLYKYLLSQTISPLPGFEIPQGECYLTF